MAIDDPVQQDDLSALSWVHDEVRRSLETAHKALRRYLKEAAQASDLDSVDPGVLRQARTQLHQSVGVLELVGLGRAAEVLRASEGALARLSARPRLITAAAVDTIERGSFALLDFIGRRLAGKPVSTLALFPQYRALQELAGASRAHPADLWTVDWAWHELPADAHAAPRQADAQTLERIEADLLALMRGAPPAVAAHMSELFAGLAAGQQVQAARAGDTVPARRLATLWTLAAGFFEAQAHGLFKPDAHGKRVGSRLLAQLRAGPQAEANERLAHDLLFFCAQAVPQPGRPAGPRLAAVRAAWSLGDEPPVDYEQARLGRHDPAWVAQARKRVGLAKEVWSAVAGGDAERLSGLAEPFALVNDSLARLYPDSGALGRALQAAAAQSSASGHEPPAALAMEVATALLYLEASLDDGDFDQPGSAERIQRLAERIDAVRDGRDPGTLELWMEELYRRVSDRQTMGSVVQELRASLSDIENHIDQYFRDPAQRELLIPVPAKLSAMRGVLSVLGLDQAAHAVLRMRDDVDALANTEVDPQRAIAAGTFDRLADNLGALSFLIDMVSVQPQMAKSLFRFDPDSGNLSAVMARADRPTGFDELDTRADDHPPPSPDTDALAVTLEFDRLVEQAGQVRSAPRLPTLHFDDQPDTTPDGLHTLPEQAPTLALQPTLPAATEPLPALDFLAGAAAPALADTVQDTLHAPEPGTELLTERLTLPPLSLAELPPPAPVPAAVPLAAPAPVVADAGLDDDPEMRAIFLEEATEVLQGAREALDGLARRPDDVDAMTTVRRAFHTLKGSARMVGLREFGEAAWACEQLYNARLAEAGEADADLRGFSAEVCDHFEHWVLALAGGQAAGFHADDVVPAAHALRTERRRLPLGQAAAAAVPALPEAPRPAEPAAAAPAPEPAPVPAGLDLAEADLAEPNLAEADLAALDLAPAEPAPAAGGDEDWLRLPELLPPAEPVAPPETSALRARVPDLPLASDLDLGLPAAAPALPALDLEPLDLAALDELPATAPEAPPAPAIAVAEATELELPAELAAAFGALLPEPPAPAEAEARPATVPLPEPEAPAAPVAEDEEDVRQIGPLRVPTPLFNIYLGEADELSRRLGQALGDWAASPQRPPSDEAVALAHSLAGSSATVGFADLSALARALEHALERTQARGEGRDDEAALYVQAAGEIHRLLHLFAAGFLNAPDAALLGRLQQLAHAAPQPTEPLSPALDAGDTAFELTAFDLAPAEAAVAEPAAPAVSALEGLPPGPGPLAGGVDLAPVEALREPAALPPAEDTALGEATVVLGPLAAPDEAGRAAAEPAPEPDLALDLPDLPDLPLDFAPEPPAQAAEPPPSEGAATPVDLDVSAAPATPSEAGFVAEPLAEPAAEAATEADAGIAAAAALGRAALLPFAALPEALPVAAQPTEPLAVGALDEDLDEVDELDPELQAIFTEEVQELLPQLQTRLRDWSQQPGDAAAASACMRSLHTLKGSARLAGAMRLGEMAHRLESAVERLVAAAAPGAGAPRPVAAADVDTLIGLADTLQAHVDTLCGAPAALAPVAAPPAPVPPAASVPVPAALPAAPVAPAMAAEAVAVTPAAPASAAAPGLPPPAIDWQRFAAPVEAAALAEPGVLAAHAAGSVRVRTPLLDRLVNQAGEVSIARARIDADVGQLKTALGELTDNLERLRSQLRDIELQAETQITTRMEAARAAAQQFDPLEMDRFTRFQELTRMMAESVADVATVQRGLQRTLQSTEDQLAHQARMTRDMQDDLLRTRMVEFEGLSERLYRVVRQAAKETGKPVRLDIVGGRTEIDRGVLDRMTPAFEHLLRNSVVHGIEPPEGRAAAGKDATGTITLAVTQTGNEVAVEVRDDGAGLDLARIRARGLAMGLLAPEATPDDAELANLIFQPGFTTAGSLTGLAGRGVGMDVVRTDVNAMGGRIETASAPGQGTSFRLVLPLTTAVTQVVMLRCGERAVAVPSTLIEIVKRVPLATLAQAYDSGVFADGEAALPFFWLDGLFGGTPRGLASGRSAALVVIRSAAQRVVLHVDEVLANQDVVVKNLGPQLSRVPGLVGITLLPSGLPALIYNPVALATLYGDAARQATLAALRAAAQAGLGGEAGVRAAERPLAPLVLVVDDSLTVRRITQRLLEREGYRVAVAKDGLDGLEKLAQERPAVLLTDIEMPRMDGFDLVRNLRHQPALADLPVIMITSRIAQKHRDVAASLGVDHYLGKPYAEDELLALVARHARRAAALPH